MGHSILDADEHEQLGGSAGQPRQVRGGGIDEQADTGVARQGAWARASRHADERVLSCSSPCKSTWSVGVFVVPPCLSKFVTSLGCILSQYRRMEHTAAKEGSFYFNPSRDVLWLSTDFTDVPEYLEQLTRYYGD